MKATFSFNLPEEREEYETYRKAPAVASFLWEFEQLLRDNRKYGITEDISAHLPDGWAAHTDLIQQVIDVVETAYYKMKNHTD